MNDDQFFGWWNGDDLTPDNDFPKDSPIWWAWEGWQAALREMNKEPWVKTYSGGKPNYTEPKEWVGLTNDERIEVSKNLLDQCSILELLLRIEEKLKEKNA